MARLSRKSRFGFRAVPRRLRTLTRCKRSLNDGRDLKAENEDLRGRVKRLESALNRMSSQCVNQAMEIAQQKAELKTRSERIETLVHSFDFLEEEHRNLIEEMSALEVECDRLKAELSEKDEVSPETIKILTRITAALPSSAPAVDPDVVQTTPCCICLGSMADAFLFLPCCHVCCCRGCFVSNSQVTLKKCPVCRAQIDVALQAFVS